LFEPVSLSAETPPAGASAARRLGTRAVFLYLLLYGLSQALAGVPGLSSAATGSSDRTFDYLQALCLAVLALAAAAVWAARDRRPELDARLARNLRVGLRWFVGLTLLLDGLGKVIPAQFAAPGLARLEERLGDSSPMALFLVFMGYGTAYAVFTGLCETVAGALLLVRRTATLGALVALGMLGNAFLLAISYDLPIKLATLHLLAMTAIVLAPDLRRVVDALVLDRATVPPPPLPPLSPRRRLLVGLAVGALLLGIAKRDLDVSRAARAARERSGPPVDPARYLLLNRGFHLINDDPVNR
jgi:hypothetical protein